jgi:hypothetical protein
MFRSGSCLTAKLSVRSFVLGAVACLARRRPPQSRPQGATSVQRTRSATRARSVRNAALAAVILAAALIVPGDASFAEGSTEVELDPIAIDEAQRELVDQVQALETAWDLERQLVELALRHPEDLRAVPIFREVAERRMVLFDQWNAGEYPWQMVVGGYCGTFGQIITCSRHAAARSVLADAQTYYADAVRVLLRNELYDSDELRALEMELVRTSDLPRAQPELADETRRPSVSMFPVRRPLPVRPVSSAESERDPVAVALGMTRSLPSSSSSALDRRKPNQARLGARVSRSTA